jgi:hypothetical protein
VDEDVQRRDASITGWGCRQDYAEDENGNAIVTCRVVPRDYRHAYTIND